ncbi:MAG: DUF5995 family protein [Anaerolineales bacterium]
MHRVRARTIDDVITFMDAIVNQSITLGDRLGYFTGLYRLVTIEVKKRCDEGFFEDNDRMRELDVLFANRFFDALAAYKRREAHLLTDAWRMAFEAAKDPDLMIMQHLLLGMNAHINLDLGIATAEVSGGVLTPGLRRDFDKLNALLTELSDQVQVNIISVSPLFRRFEPLYRYFDEMFVRVGISTARTRAWKFAETLIATPDEDWPAVIAARDASVGELGARIQNPGLQLIPLVKLVSQSEKKDIHGVVSILCGESWNRPLRFTRDQLREEARRRGISWDD